MHRACADTTHCAFSSCNRAKPVWPLPAAKAGVIQPISLCSWGMRLIVLHSLGSSPRDTLVAGCMWTWTSNRQIFIGSASAAVPLVTCTIPVLSLCNDMCAAYGQAVDPRKGPPILIRPGQVQKLTWKPAPPHPDVVMCCGGALQLSWSPMDSGVVASGGESVLC